MTDAERTATLEELRAERHGKGQVLQEHGRDLYPATSHRTHEIAAVREQFAALQASHADVTLAGRVLSIRRHGGAMFIDLYDGTGAFQGYLTRDALGEAVFDLFVDTIDRGDFVELTGTLMTTKRGEPSLAAGTWRILSKSILPMPTQHFGIKDEDERYRKRYLDILLNSELRRRIERRSVFWNAARQFLLQRNFLEVETPVFETTPGGAEARPFVTHHNALDMDVYLRISAGELWQKRLMVAGVPKCFEIGRIFRNEGMSSEHLQDYTQLEFYEAYNNAEQGKSFVRDLYIHLARETFDTTQFSARGHTFDIDALWQNYDYAQLMEDRYGFDPRDANEETALQALKDSSVTYSTEKPLNLERAVDLLWKQIRAGLPGPGYLVNVPVYLEPLAKRSEEDARVVDRFQVILAGSEVGKGFSELNDPRDQADRFARQEALRTAGDDEAQFADQEFVEALEYGMPPTFGFGVSERLFSILEGVPVREGQIFPLMRRR